jgi:AcrR family transcriptional regulator
MAPTVEESRLTPKGRATRARIVAAAAALMSEQGVAATTLDEVRKAAGVGGSQINHYFADKSDLVRAVIDHQAESILDRHRGLELGGLETLACLDLWAERSLAEMTGRACEGGCPLGSLAGELTESSPELRDGLADSFRRWEATLRDGLLTMRDNGELRADADPDVLAYSLLAALQGGALLARTERDPAPLEAALRAAVDHVHSFAAA